MKNLTSPSPLSDVPTAPSVLGSVAERFAKPSAVDDASLAFGGDTNKLMPRYDEIPEEFTRHGGNPYIEFQRQWFFRGLDEADIPAARPGIDRRAALRHLDAVQRSFRPKHEHKQAAVAYLASLWLEEPKVRP